MVESNNDFGGGSKIKPYQFEAVHATAYSDSEYNSNELETTSKLY